NDLEPLAPKQGPPFGDRTLLQLAGIEAGRKTGKLILHLLGNFWPEQFAGFHPRINPADGCRFHPSRFVTVREANMVESSAGQDVPTEVGHVEPLHDDDSAHLADQSATGDGLVPPAQA